MAEALIPWDGFIVPVRDARRGEIYLGTYRSEGNHVERLTDYRALPPRDVIEEIAGLAGQSRVLVAGDALDRYGSLFGSLPGNVELAGQERWPPRPATVALIGLRLLREGVTLDLRTAEPLYIRPSEAERMAHGPAHGETSHTADDA
jgi:tRNA threonylcarbamoyladenosine biosynthesis protein TsaB